MAKRANTDPARVLALLWRSGAPASEQGRAELSIGKIVRAAVRIADDEGLAALTMRKVSQALGVGTMSSYTYVRGKADLLALMMDIVYAETPRPEHGPDWRDNLERIARENWALHRAHPWLARVENSRPVLGPNSLAKYDYELCALTGTGLSAVDKDSVRTLVLGHVKSTARDAADADDLVRDTGMTDAQWWRVQQPLLETYLRAGTVETAATVGSAVGEQHDAAYDPEHAFEFGLHRLLDGVAVHIRQRSIVD